jgi:hypothetical protein
MSHQESSKTSNPFENAPNSQTYNDFHREDAVSEVNTLEIQSDWIVEVIDEDEYDEARDS